MFRAAFITVAVVGLSNLSVSRGQAPDPIKAALDKAKATYAADMANYRKAVLEYFDKRAEDAAKEAAKTTYGSDLQKFRKAVTDHFAKREDDARQLGDKKQVDQIKIERKAFEEKGDLPASAPAALRQLQTAAKKAKQGVEAQQALIFSIKTERHDFEEAGLLPAMVPAPLKMMPLVAATKLETAYVQAIKEYTKTKNDDEADAVEKQLDEFKPLAVRKPGNVVEVEIAKGVKMKFCWVPSGEAQLGSPEGERQAVLEKFGASDAPEWLLSEAEEKRGKFKTKGFWLGKYEVTQEEWRALMGTNPSTFVPAEATVKKHGIRSTSRFPVENVSWNDCQDFLKKMNESVKNTGGMGKGIFALPHEDQWEYACRGGKGNKQAYYFGNEHNGKLANSPGLSPFGTATKGPSLQRPTEVGSYERLAPHPWGLCDMSGNVWEWTGLENDAIQMIRGGGWQSDGFSCRSARRLGSSPTSRGAAVGFRVARVPAGE